ncbi:MULTISPECIES: GAF domain-containing protein [unclassified Halomonas]|uniref:GAF domain-containing protein n=1 Tax=unclassified Halomonas TaxID=2609666 RepID=UPI0007D9481D|nr:MULTISPECIES: GAF domain-containing protein [unclassified Halomonas]MBT2784977.1 GAF domain-containing protein [Halomonas sp. ISL-106]MBT2796671.1 GAF domain-containing protein [Halomonas sp. ISL-104]OAL59903.1 hypothetical protein A6R74_01140 [Halomonas sp. ALS9]
MSEYIELLQNYLPYLSVVLSVAAVAYSLYAARKTIDRKERKLSLINQYYRKVLNANLDKEDIYKSSKAIQETLSRLSEIINDEHDFGASASFKIFVGDGSENIRTYLRDINNSNNREILRDVYPIAENKLFMESLYRKQPVFIENFSSPKEAIYYNTSNENWKSKYLSVWVFPVKDPKSEDVIGFLTVDTKERMSKNNEIYELTKSLGESTANYIANLVGSLKPHNKQSQSDA